MQSAIHDPRANLTPSQHAAAMAHNMRRAKIAAKAVTPQPPRVVTFEIPNTPFGVPKYLPRPVVKRDPPVVYRMWFEDLIDEAESQIQKRGPRKVLVEDIQYECAKHYGVTRESILSPCRLKIIVKPRQVAMYLAKTMTERSLPDIGRRFGNRDHTTGLHAIRKMERLVVSDTALAAEIDQIKAAIAVRVA